MSNRSSQYVLPTRSTTNTQTFLDTCVLDADHKALEEHLMNNQVGQSDLDRCVLRGLRTVERKATELSHMAPSLTLLLQSGATWNSDALLDEQKTPYHIICESPGDHHELLGLMIKSSQQTIIDAQDIHRRTALVCAVEHANINCVKCLIANRADLIIGGEGYPVFVVGEIISLTPIIKAIWLLKSASKYTSVILTDIFDLLLDAAVDQNNDHFRNCTDYIHYALYDENINCVKKLINAGAPLNAIDKSGCYVWEWVARKGDVGLLKCMFKRGFDKDTTNEDGVSVLWWVLMSGNVEAVRYLLDQGVVIPTYVPEVRATQCEDCKEDKLIIDDDSELEDPCLMAIVENHFELLKFLDEYGSQSFKSFTAIRCAVTWGSVDIVSYLLNKYTYPLNIEYILKDSSEGIFTLLSERNFDGTSQMTKLLLDHGADPAKPMCAATSVNATMTAIKYGHLDAIAQYVRSGVDINFRSLDSTYGNILPFEASIKHRRHSISVMLLISGCSRGMFSNHKFKVNPEPDLEKLMKEWNVYDTNVIPLKQRCRCVILNHLSPRADLKIEKLPLPPCLIKFLSIPDLDDIVYEYNKADRR